MVGVVYLPSHFLRWNSTVTQCSCVGPALLGVTDFKLWHNEHPIISANNVRRQLLELVVLPTRGRHSHVSQVSFILILYFWLSVFWTVEGFFFSCIVRSCFVFLIVFFFSSPNDKCSYFERSVPCAHSHTATKFSCVTQVVFIYTNDELEMSVTDFVLKKKKRKLLAISINK